MKKILNYFKVNNVTELIGNPGFILFVKNVEVANKERIKKFNVCKDTLSLYSKKSVFDFNIEKEKLSISRHGSLRKTLRIVNR